MILTFYCPGGFAGRFVTVRSEDIGDLAAGDIIEMVDAKGAPLGQATAIDCWAGDLARIPASILELEQNPLHRTYSGLIMGLRALQREPIAPETRVTALILDLKQ